MNKTRLYSSVAVVGVCALLLAPAVSHAAEGVTQLLKVGRLNVTKNIFNSKGAVKIKDTLTVTKDALFKQDVTVDGNLAVGGTSTFTGGVGVMNVDFGATADLTGMDTSGLVGGEVYYNEDDSKLYLWDGTAWVDLSAEPGDSVFGESIDSSEITDDTIVAADIDADAVGSSELAADAVGTSEIANDTIAAADISADAVGTSEIAADGVGSSEIAAGAVGTSELADGIVANADLEDDSIDFDKVIDAATLDAATSIARSSNTTAENSLSLNLTNTGGSAGTDQVFVISNAISTATSGDTTTEALLVLDQADTTGTGTTAVSDALLITNSGGSTVTDGIQIGSGTQPITNGINIASTGVTTDLSLQNGETIDNNSDGTLTLTATTVSTSAALTAAGTLTANGTVALGDNGDTVAVNSSDWDISTTGAMTGIGAITADGTLTMSGVSTDVTTGTDEALTVAPNGTGDLIVDTDANSQLILNGGGDGVDSLVLTDGDVLVTDGDVDVSGGDFNVTLDAADGASFSNAAATADALTVTATAAGNDGQQVSFTLGDDADTDTVAALDLGVTSAATSDADTLVGLNVANLASADGTVVERGAVIGSGWDANLLFADTTTQVQITDAGTLTLENVTGTDFVTFAAGTTTFTGNLVPEAASTRDLGTTSAEFDDIFVGDQNGVNFGLGQAAELGYDEAGQDRVELSGSNADLWIEDVLSLGKQSFSTASGGGSESLTVTASFIAVTVTDDDDVVQLQETGANDGDLLYILNVDATATDSVGIDAIANQVDLVGGADVVLDQSDAITLMYSSDLSAWVQVAASNNTPL